MTTRDITEENGAIQVDTAVETPLIVFLAGPIKHWWGDNWDTPAHREYMAWRDAVRLAVVATGFCVTYSPHRALQGAWHEDLQRINDAAIQACDVMLVLTPKGVPADGTAGETELAYAGGKWVWNVPPGDDLEEIVLALEELHASKLAPAPFRDLFTLPEHLRGKPTDHHRS